MGDGMLSLSWNNHKATFCHILSTLREKERYTDVTLACEGKFYPVHKLVLSTCSEYFENMFEHTPCKHPIIVLKDVKPDELEALLSYMYAGVVNVAQNDLARLIKAAELLQIKGLAVPDEPPQEAESKKTTVPPWSSRDDRSSPHPKRRKKGDENGTPSIGGSQPSASPASSPRASPFHLESDHHQDNLRTHNELYISEHRIEKSIDTRPEQRLEARVDHNVETRIDPAPPPAPGSPVQVMVDETLVKEEIVDTVDDSRDDGLDSGMDYGALGADSRVGGSSDGMGADHPSQMLPNKFDQPMVPTQQHLPDSVTEALAGPSGMQGWLTGSDLSGGFSSMDGYGGEGSRQDMRPPLPTQQPQGHQLMRLESDDHGLGRRVATGPTITHSSTNKVGLESESHGTPVSMAPRNGVSLSRRYHCSYCTYSSSVTTNYRNHMRTHTGEKPYSCPHCPYSATTRTTLKRHVRTHTGERPYACSYCSYRSNQKGTLKSHVLAHHATTVSVTK
ncbi:broad-complex core protein isoforms 1/2/3/4/5-like isoform X2 [Penaeus chinensis]|uniref:broad-complex core protein isoforms 1/2/3/4/5-like isoform X2 n=1 Tax=Penaeus chinensis TaxID=139456 RepID=UPI001FB6933E|nr:broad-complex core protein isoforms 1/2/3/4/5-like isoform X2 [Penaeus chinensis]